MAMLVISIIILTVTLLLMAIPIVIATKKNHPHKLGIILTSILGSLFLGIGWLIALIWCFVFPTAPSIATELEKLAKLKEQGSISQKEFDRQKELLLQA